MNELPKINCCMKRNVIFVGVNTTLGEAVHLMVEKKVGTLPIVDETGLLAGVTTISDIIQIFLPDFVALLSHINFVKDFGIFKIPFSGDHGQRGKTFCIRDHGRTDRSGR